MNPNIFISLLILTFLFSACEKEPKTPIYDKEYLYGRWELTDAWRNKKKTEMLVGTFYEFDREGQMRTNFNMEMTEKNFEYDFDGQVITQKSEPISLLIIDSLTESTLMFNMEFNNSKFKMGMGKIQESETEL